MVEYLYKYWNHRIEKVKTSLEKNNYEVFVARDSEHAHMLFFETIYPNLNVTSVSWGDSMTFHATGILTKLMEDENLSVIKTFDTSVSREEIIQRRRQALLVDLFFTGTNAVTEKGQLVNLDMVGNRVAGITFGPKYVVLFIGRNKITPDLEHAMERIRRYAAPINAIRHTGFKTPCIKTGYCHDCSSPDRICNTWVITEKSFPKGRIKIVLINEDDGL